ncbi:hypothetical protein BDR26DRAFT_892050 [Obelidium mucronatum]|nr:hypothetical protein BDR26DRAFT_892050 [Obelidium mucronatum]
MAPSPSSHATPSHSQAFPLPAHPSKQPTVRENAKPGLAAGLAGLTKGPTKGPSTKSTLTTPPLSDSSASSRSGSSRTKQAKDEEAEDDSLPLGALVALEQNKKRRSVSFMVAKDATPPQHHVQHNQLQHRQLQLHLQNQHSHRLEAVPKSCVKKKTSPITPRNSSEFGFTDQLIVNARVWMADNQNEIDDHDDDDDDDDEQLSSDHEALNKDDSSEDDDTKPLSTFNHMTVKEMAEEKRKDDAINNDDDDDDDDKPLAYCCPKRLSARIEACTIDKEVQQQHVILIKMRISRSQTRLSTVLELLEGKAKDVLQKSDCTIKRILVPSRNRERWIELNMRDEIEWRIRVGEVCGRDELSLFVDVTLLLALVLARLGFKHRRWLWTRLQNWRRAARTTAQLPHRAQFDYVIVGGGSAGCALANRLTEDPTVSVLLVEAGADRAKDPRVWLPALFTDAQMSDLDWKYKTVEDPGTRGRMHYWPRGKVLGGCSSINAMAYVRGNKADFDDWESKHGCSGWNYSRVLPYFMKSEGCTIPEVELDKTYHSKTGPLKVSRVSSNKPHEISKAFVKAAETLGVGQAPDGTFSKSHATAYPSVNGIDYNGACQYGAGIAQTTTENGERWSTARAFLDPIVDPGSASFRRNLTVLTGHVATRLLKSGRRDIEGKLLVDGVELVSDDARKHVVLVSAVKEVVLACGRKQDLEKLNIPVIADIPAVGYNMQDHIFVIMPYEDLSHTVLKKSLKTVVTGVFQYLWDKTGPFTSSALEAMAFFNVQESDDEDKTGSDRDGRSPAMQIHLLPIMAPEDARKRLLRDTISLVPLDPAKPSAFKKEEAMREYMYMECGRPNRDYAFIFPTLLHPTSKGTVTLTSADPFAPPRITPNYLSTKKDVDTLVEGMKSTRLIMDEARRLVPKILGNELPDVGILNEIKRIRGLDVGVVDLALDAAIMKSREYMEERVRRDAVTVYHPVGTCRMGPLGGVGGGRDTVVSHLDLKVHGFGNLRVADASVMPEITSGNTNAPCIMIGEVCADMIQGRF